MAFFGRRQRAEYKPPPPPSEELIEAVSEVSTTAETQLDRVREREGDIDTRTNRLAQIRRENALGRRFWQAVGETRGT